MEIGVSGTWQMDGHCCLMTYKRMLVSLILLLNEVKKHVRELGNVNNHIDAVALTLIKKIPYSECFINFE